MPLGPSIVRRHPRATLVIVLVGIALLLFGILWFEPQKLFLEERVDEALPGMAAGSTGMEAEMDAAEGGGSGSPVLMGGEFIGLEHATSGQAVVVETGDGRRFLRFEDFETSNGPDLLVYLSSKAPSGPDDWYGYDEDFVDLGPLKGNIGSQNYLIPEGVDLDRYATAVVWCRRFTVGFAAATLQ
jgi:hypothetical protein